VKSVMRPDCAARREPHHQTIVVLLPPQFPAVFLSSTAVSRLRPRHLSASTATVYPPTSLSLTTRKRTCSHAPASLTTSRVYYT
jgi:hypothetical protein